jgi:hypothetical protein
LSNARRDWKQGATTDKPSCACQSLSDLSRSSSVIKLTSLNATRSCGNAPFEEDPAKIQKKFKNNEKFLRFAFFRFSMRWHTWESRQQCQGNVINDSINYCDIKFLINGHRGNPSPKSRESLAKSEARGNLSARGNPSKDSLDPGPETCTRRVDYPHARHPSSDGQR